MQDDESYAPRLACKGLSARRTELGIARDEAVVSGSFFKRFSLSVTEFLQVKLIASMSSSSVLQGGCASE